MLGDLLSEALLEFAKREFAFCELHAESVATTMNAGMSLSILINGLVLIVTDIPYILTCISYT